MSRKMVKKEKTKNKTWWIDIHLSLSLYIYIFIKTRNLSLFSILKHRGERSFSVAVVRAPFFFSPYVKKKNKKKRRTNERRVAVGPPAPNLDSVLMLDLQPWVALESWAIALRFSPDRLEFVKRTPSLWGGHFARRGRFAAYEFLLEAVFGGGWQVAFFIKFWSGPKNGQFQRDRHS